jgi:hypothetical protein
MSVRRPRRRNHQHRALPRHRAPSMPDAQTRADQDRANNFLNDIFEGSQDGYQPPQLNLDGRRGPGTRGVEASLQQFLADLAPIITPQADGKEPLSGPALETEKQQRFQDLMRRSKQPDGLSPQERQAFDNARARVRQSVEGTRQSAGFAFQNGAQPQAGLAQPGAIRDKDGQPTQPRAMQQPRAQQPRAPQQVDRQPQPVDPDLQQADPVFDKDGNAVAPQPVLPNPGLGDEQPVRVPQAGEHPRALPKDGAPKQEDPDAPVPGKIRVLAPAFGDSDYIHVDPGASKRVLANNGDDTTYTQTKRKPEPPSKLGGAFD